MEEIAPGLWHWTALHPEWEQGDGWPPTVSSYAWDDGESLTLFDPLDVPREVLELIAQRDAAVVLTAPWHERDARALAQTLRIPVLAPWPDSEDDLMAKFDVDRSQAAGGSPDLAWLRSPGDESSFFRAGDEPRPGVRAHLGSEHNDLALVIDGPRAVVFGDTVIDDGAQVGVWSESIGHRRSRESVLDDLRSLFTASPVQHVLLTHGGPVSAAVLANALD